MSLSMQQFEEADIAIALDNIRKCGGTVMDADVLELALGDSTLPELDQVRKGFGDKQLADKLSDLVFTKPH